MLGDHVKQAGSLVAPDRLRFDFSHYEPVTAEQIEQIERLANAETLANTPVRSFETTKAEAEELGAIAFFGDKYGDIVRVLEAGLDRALRRHARARHRRHRHDQGGQRGLDRLQPAPHRGGHRRGQRRPAAARRAGARRGRGSSAPRRRPRRRGAAQARRAAALADELKVLRAKLATGRAGELAGAATDGVVVQRVDGLRPGELRELALAVRNESGVDVVVLGGETTAGGVSLVAAVAPGSASRRRR